jgi:hypothetical protein
LSRVSGFIVFESSKNFRNFKLANEVNSIIEIEIIIYPWISILFR